MSKHKRKNRWQGRWPSLSLGRLFGSKPASPPPTTPSLPRISGVAYPVKPPPPPDPALIFTHSWPETVGFKPVVSEAAFNLMTAFLLQEHRIEIAGIFHWHEATNTIDWAWRDMASDGSGGHVKSDSGQGVLACVLAGHGAPNGQWHTHPGFGTFWSGTDLTDQGRVVQKGMKINQTGYTLFMVCSGLNWFCRVVRWQEGKVVLCQDGHAVRWDGLALNFADHRYDPKPVVAKPGSLYPIAGGAHYVGGGWSNGYDDDWSYYDYRGNDRQPALPIALPAIKQDDASIWALPGTDYRPLFDRFGVPYEHWNKLEKVIDSEYQGMFVEVMAHPDWWADL